MKKCALWEARAFPQPFRESEAPFSQRREGSCPRPRRAGPESQACRRSIGVGSRPPTHWSATFESSFQGLDSADRLIFVAVHKLSNEWRNRSPYSLWVAQPWTNSRKRRRQLVKSLEKTRLLLNRIVGGPHQPTAHLNLTRSTCLPVCNPTPEMIPLRSVKRARRGTACCARTIRKSPLV